ncbi:MAG: type VI secretion system protein IglI family protein [Syntrophobacterales bacterium]|jgi:hypothetical protein
MNVDILNTTLEVSENPGLDMIDPRFMDITTLVENGDYEEAATQAEQILAEGAYDIRITGYFLYGVFLEQGLGGLTAILQCLTKLFTENWDAVGPVKNREKHAQTSLNWFLRQLVKKLQYEEGKDSDVYQQWVAEISSDEVQEALDASEELQGAFGTALEDQAEPLLDGLSKVNEWLSTFQRLVYREPEPELEEQVESAEVEPAEMVAPVGAPIADVAVSAEGSYHLQLLLKKMEVFSRLIEKEDFPKAAIVADDINQIIADFDPRIYFPKMFSRYSLLRAVNIGELNASEEHKGTLEWQTMQDLYKVDLDSFFSFDSEMTYSTPAPERPYEEEEYEEEETYEEPEGSPEEW